MHEHLGERFAAVSRRLGFRAESLEEWKAWREELREKLRELMGCTTMRKAPLEPKLTEETDCGEYLRQRIEIQTEPGVVMPLYALVPTAAKDPFPAVLAPHGHGGGGKVAVANVRVNEEVAQSIDGHNYAYGVAFARAGCIAFCPDARGFGERQAEQAKENVLDSSCQQTNSMAFPLGQTASGMWAWDLHRLIDYVETREDCIPGRIGCAGLSGGGLQTLYATALDDRIACATISGYFYGVRESLLDMICCNCNYIPHLFEYADMGDIGALIAPRPLCIETGTVDELNGASGLANVESQVRIARAAYDLLGAAGNLVHDVFEGPHRWNGIVSVPFMVKHLGG